MVKEKKNLWTGKQAKEKNFRDSALCGPNNEPLPLKQVPLWGEVLVSAGCLGCEEWQVGTLRMARWPLLIGGLVWNISQCVEICSRVTSLTILGDESAE